METKKGRWSIHKMHMQSSNRAFKSKQGTRRLMERMDKPIHSETLIDSTRNSVFSHHKK